MITRRGLRPCLLFLMLHCRCQHHQQCINRRRHHHCQCQFYCYHRRHRQLLSNDDKSRLYSIVVKYPDLALFIYHTHSERYFTHMAPIMNKICVVYAQVVCFPKFNALQELCLDHLQPLSFGEYQRCTPQRPVSSPFVWHSLE